MAFNCSSRSISQKSLELSPKAILCPCLYLLSFMSSAHLPSSLTCSCPWRKPSPCCHSASSSHSSHCFLETPISLCFLSSILCFGEVNCTSTNYSARIVVGYSSSTRPGKVMVVAPHCRVTSMGVSISSLGCV